MPQDLPPEGGYAPIQFKRNLPFRGIRPSYYLLGMAVIMGYGWYRLGQGIREKNELVREKMWARIYLTPLLQAEADRDNVRRQLADEAREQFLLGRVSKPYHSSRYVAPTYAATPEHRAK